jgi:hypothetical protein
LKILGEIWESKEEGTSFLYEGLEEEIHKRGSESLGECLQKRKRHARKDVQIEDEMINYAKKYGVECNGNRLSLDGVPNSEWTLRFLTHQIIQKDFKITGKGAKREKGKMFWSLVSSLVQGAASFWWKMGHHLYDKICIEQCVVCKQNSVTLEHILCKCGGIICWQETRVAGMNSVKNMLEACQEVGGIRKERIVQIKSVLIFVWLRWKWWWKLCKEGKPGKKGQAEQAKNVFQLEAWCEKDKSLVQLWERMAKEFEEMVKVL